MSGSVTPTFSGEVQLAGWSETHTGGCKVTFWLADSAELDAFRAMTVRKGNTAGQRMACVLVEIGDDEQPVQPIDTSTERVQKEVESVQVPKGGPLARLAGQWCNDPAFQFWMVRTFPGQWNFGANVLQSERCAMVVRDLCEVESRAELDSDPAAAHRFNTLIRFPYMAHMKVAA